MTRQLFLFILAFCAVQAEAQTQLPSPAKQTVDFVRDIHPIFRKRCFECHATGNVEGGLNLAVKKLVMAGGENGPIVKAGDSAKSSLIQRVASTDSDRMMPPEGERLTSKQIGLLRAWIDQGATWPASADVTDPRMARAKEHWAFNRLTPSKFEEDINPSKVIDDCIVQKLKTKSLRPSKQIDARRLARRLCFDLIGLPPTPEQMSSFLKAAETNSKLAISQLIDQLLDSRHYGERWGRHWLDVVRYADSDGQEADRDRPHAYHFRDFVIQSFNDDMPFNQFVRWQLAGDEYEPKNPQAIIATGFLIAGPHTVLADTFLEEERLRNRYNELDDIVSTVGVSLLGITIGCARCHDHKYDAIQARDYYSLLSAFHSGNRKTGKLPDGRDGQFFRDFGTEVKPTWLFRRADFYDRELPVRLSFPIALTTGRDANDYLQAAQQKVDKPASTLQRRALADWVTDIKHGAGGLLARVIVNRIWQHHFGRGLVRTESDFGVRSESPTHPELLERLSADFVANGWKIKRLHRMILQTATWQQDVVVDPAKEKVDVENRLLWRMQPKRLEAEVLRDAMLAASGTLNSKAFGPGFKPHIPSEAILARNLKDGGYPKNAKDSPETRRRSVYMFHKRVVPYPLFQAFDRPDLLQSCGRRQNTTVAPQALALLNDAFVRSVSGDFAKRLIAHGGDDNAKVVDRSFELALNRSPTEAERQNCVDFIQAQTETRKSRREDKPRHQAITDYCQSLFSLNEFIYVD